jgi:hypothetical protein
LIKERRVAVKASVSLGLNAALCVKGCQGFRIGQFSPSRVCAGTNFR